jgi:tetratricopeptide (TPR) repeat protein
VSGQSHSAAVQTLALAVRHHQEGRFPEAEQLYRQILAAAPDHADALNFLAAVCYQTGRLTEAAAHWQRLTELQPGLAAAHFNLGLAYKDLGKLDDAASCFRRALGLQPDAAGLHYHLGTVLHLQGKLDEAITCWRRVAELNPKSAEAHFNLAVVYTDRENFAEAVACCRRAIALKSDFAEAHSTLGNALRETGDFDEAIAACRTAIALKPGLAEAHNNLGNALKDRGELDEAVASYRRAIELSPNFAKAHFNLGAVEELLGDFRYAESCFRAALSYDTGFAPAHYSLAKLLRGKLPDDELAAQRRLLADNSLPDKQRMLLHFGLAQVLDARGEYAAVAKHLQEAHAVQAAEWSNRGLGFDPEAHERLVTRIIEVCTPELFERMKGIGNQSEVPVFIVGLPRSGTTLIEQILAAHSRVFAAGEIRLVAETLAGFARPGGDFLSGLGQTNTAEIGHATSRHLEKLRAYNRAAPTIPADRIVDKLPDNYLYLGPLAVLFPRAKFIHCRRDLRDVAFSCWMTHFQEIRWANNEQHIVAQFRQYQRIMDHWRKVLTIPMLEIDYEAAVSDLDTTARRLIAWCGLDWEPNCLMFHEAKRPVSTASAYQVRQPIYDTSVQRWRHYERPLAGLFAQIDAIAPGLNQSLGGVF